MNSESGRHEESAGLQDSGEIVAANAITTPQKPSKLGRMYRLALKELREILRDRRTIATLLVMPIIVYPILSLALKQFLLGSDQPEANQQVRVGFDTFDDMLLFDQYYKIAFMQSQKLEDEKISSFVDKSKEKAEYPDLRAREIRDPSLEQLVANGNFDLGIRLQRTAYRPPRVVGITSGIHCEFVYRKGSVVSEKALQSVKKHIEQLNTFDFQRRLSMTRMQVDKIVTTNETSATERDAKTAPLATLVPLVLILMTITGAVYPAIDLTAGERERGTLETLIAAPVPRMGILLAKFVAVLTVAMLTAAVNLIGMMTTIWVFQIGTMIFGEQGITFQMFAAIFLLLLLFASFFSSILLAITSCARSFKEAQAYLIPVMLVAMTPGLMSLMPSFELRGVLVVIPLVNIVLLARDVMQGSVDFVSAVVAVVSTIIYGCFAIAIASRIFGTNAVLFGNQQTISTLFKYPSKESSVATPATAWFTLAILFPINFLWLGLLVRLQPIFPATYLLMFATVGTILQFAVVPALVMRFRRIKLLSGFGLNRPTILAYVGAILLGFSLGILLIQLYSMFGSQSAANEQLVKQAEVHVERWRQIPAPLVLVCMSLVPAVCEELFFRGMLFRSLSKATNATNTILITGILFGLFHILAAGSIASSRFIPTTLMGLILGWVCYKTKSVIPGMILHTIHNLLYVSLAYFLNDLVEAGWILRDQKELPFQIVIVAACGAVAGILVMIQVGRQNRRFQNTESLAEQSLLETETT